MDGNLLQRISRMVDSWQVSGFGRINLVSEDGTLVNDSDNTIPTEKAVKTYVDAQVGAVPGAVADYDSDYQEGTTTSTSGTFANMTSASVSVTVTAAAVVVLTFQCIHKHTTGGKVNSFRLYDGSAQVGGYVQDRIGTAEDGNYYPITLHAIDVVAAGTHTYTVQWKTDASTATAAARYLSAVAYST